MRKGRSAAYLKKLRKKYGLGEFSKKRSKKRRKKTRARVTRTQYRLK